MTLGSFDTRMGLSLPSPLGLVFSRILGWTQGQKSET
jgi:hypothetical protein